MWNTGLYESLAGIKIEWEISATSDMQMITTVHAESEEELKILSMKMKEVKSWLETQLSGLPRGRVCFMDHVLLCMPEVLEMQIWRDFAI